MSLSTLRSLIAMHRCRVNGVVHRFHVVGLAREPKWSTARCLLNVRVSTDAGEDAVVHLVVRAGASSAEVMSLLHDALVVHLGGGHVPNTDTAYAEPRLA